MRSKAKWHLEGERNSRYFCNLEKKHYQEKSISKLIDDTGNELTETNDILKEQKDFYQNLYTSKKTNTSNKMDDIFFNKNNDFYILPEESSNSLEADITLDECHNALKGMKPNKTPGSDGFSSEFYLFFWNELKHIMVNSFKESLANGKLSDSQRLSIITCLPKPGKDKLYMKNWRPISLLNIDYKILAGVMANRMKTVLDPLISNTQKGFISGRYIGECTRIVSDLLYHLKKTKKPGIILMIDFEKAFDSLEWTFLEKVLKHFNFGDNITKCIKAFYKDIESCVINNGNVSSRFSLGRGVRQGDPLSPYLFILCTEILARAILSNSDIKGIKVDRSEFILSQLADDTTFFLDNDEKSFNACLETLNAFSEISGLKINYSKTVAIKINLDNNFIFKLKEGKEIKWQNNGKFTLLGIKYDLDQEDFLYINYKEKCEEVEKFLNTWSTRNLTIYGKICVIKSLALSKLIHLFSAIPNPPETIFKRLENSFFKFVWSDTSEKIKRSTLYNSHEYGGVKMPNLKYFCMAQKITWIKKLLDSQNVSDWKTLFFSNMDKQGGNYIWFSKDKNPIFSNQLNHFWKDVYLAWITVTATREHDLPQNEPIYHNPAIKINNKTIFYSDWYIKGITHINDIIKENGKLYTWEEFSQIYEIENQAFKYIAFIDAIPRNWKKRIKESGKKLTHVSDNHITKVNNLKKPSKFSYLEYMKNVATKPMKAMAKWDLYMEENLNEDEWKIIFTLPFKITLETRLRAFQYKIIHRTLPLNKWLYKCNLQNTPNCTFCLIHLETIEHLMWECNISRNIWLELWDWLKNTIPYEMMNFMDKKDIILGSSKYSPCTEHILTYYKTFSLCLQGNQSIPHFQESNQ